ncbi:hypothetical protein Bpfe_015798 [Biomphalaria pfeifferi]|uniref:Uncharacterized protein n=1 Tax=Biomphalaria pfeifferi TaxID=112525 RepID=A0AAD8BHJ0_BIOPF|nr:hypothetical protein Bpfe_015798 [Biomphalaria pfeifferi]
MATVKGFVTQDIKNSGKGKKLNSRTMPTIPSMISGEEFWNVLKRKIEEKNQENKNKLVKEMDKEEKKRKAEEVKEQRRVLKEQERTNKMS